jgi:uncharacterized membrane protein
MDFKFHLETAWKMTLSHIAPLIFISIAVIGISLISLGVMAPVAMAGYMQSILLLLRQGREPKISDIFTYMGLFLPLFLFSIAVMIVVLVGILLLFVPGIVFLLAVSFCCLYMLPLMTDRRLGLFDAALESFRMVTQKQLMDHVVVYILFTGIFAIGSTVFLGALFTLPLATLFLMSAYENPNQTVSDRPPGPPPQETG